MKLDTKLKEVDKAVSNCLKCTVCVYSEWPQNYIICPMYLYDKCFTHSGGGFMYIAKGLINEKLKIDSKISDLLFTCSGCLACDDICEVIKFSEPYVSPFDIVRLMRRELIKGKLASYDRLEMLKKQLEDFEKTSPSEEKNPLRIPETIYENNSARKLFVNLSLLNSEANVYRSALKLFEKVGEPLSVVTDGGLNFSDLYDFGFWNEIKENLVRKFDIKKFDGKELIFINPHSLEFVVKRVPEIISGYENIRTLHISEFILNAMERGKLKTKRGQKKIKVSYQDPCYLGRGLGIYETPREILRMIDSVELIEMERNRRNSFCCGARGGENYFVDFSSETALERINEFKKTGADLLITACHHCKTIFRKIMRNKRDRVKDLVEFIEEKLE